MVSPTYAKSLWSYNPIPRGCVLFLPWWHPDMQGVVTKTPDPFGHKVTRTGGVVGAEGIIQDGDDTIKVPDHVSLDIAGALTLIGWFRRSVATAASDMIMRKHNSYLLRVGNTIDAVLTGFVVQAGPGYNEIVGGTTIVQDTLYCAALTYDKLNMRLYLNGVSDASPVAESSTVLVTANDLEIGSTSGSADFWDGTQIEDAVYNVALSASEILYYYNNSYPRRFA